jgi:hypothetical protein
MSSRIFSLLAAIFATTTFFLQSNVVEAKTIDGFFVGIMPLPTFDKLPRPDSVTGEVDRYVGNGDDGAFDPFYMLKHLQGKSPYLAIYPGGSATFTFTPRTIIRFYWGTPDNFNSISFYSGGKLVGTLLGADFQNAYGISEDNRPFPVGYEDMVRVRSSVAFDEVVLSNSKACCFEFSIFRPY